MLSSGAGLWCTSICQNSSVKYFLVKLEQSVKGQKVEVQYETMGMEGCHWRLLGCGSLLHQLGASD